MKSRLEIRFAVACALLFVSLLGWFNMSKPRILILHSYDQGYAWVRDVNVGLERVLGESYRYHLRWHYMDTKRHPSQAYKESAGVAARNVIAEMHPDVVIALDDDAQQYAARYFVNDPRVRIVFAGVNKNTTDYAYDRANNVTGILERLPLGAIKEAFGVTENFKRLGRPVRVAHIGDRSDSVSGDRRQVEAFDWAPMKLSVTEQVATWPEWQALVNSLASRADVILLTGYRQLYRSAGSRQLVPADEVVKWTEAHSPIPVVSGNGFFIEDGGMLAIGTSPYEQGEKAARDALAIALDGRSPGDIPVSTATQFLVTMNGGLMRKRNFVLPRIYEAAARSGDKFVP